MTGKDLIFGAISAVMVVPMVLYSIRELWLMSDAAERRRRSAVLLHATAAARKVSELPRRTATYLYEMDKAFTGAAQALAAGEPVVDVLNAVTARAVRARVEYEGQCLELH